MGVTTELMRREENLRIQSYMEAESIVNPLGRLIELRRKIAIDMLSYKNQLPMESLHYLEEQIEFINNEIKTLLAI